MHKIKQILCFLMGGHEWRIYNRVTHVVEPWRPNGWVIRCDYCGRRKFVLDKEAK
jgi:hypothetical protein